MIAGLAVLAWFTFAIVIAAVLAAILFIETRHSRRQDPQQQE